MAMKPKQWLQRALGWTGFSSSDPRPVLHFLNNRRAGVDINYTAVLGIAAFWHGIELISDAMVENPLSVRMDVAEGEDEVAEEHPMQLLLEDGVNDELDATDFVRMTSHQVKTYGNSYWEIKRDGSGEVTELQGLEPSQTRPYVTRGTKFYDGVYTNVGAVQGVPARLRADQVLHVRGLSRVGFYGMSPIDYCGDTLGLTIAAPRYGANLFASGGIPSLALLLDSEAILTDDQIERLQENWSGGIDDDSSSEKSKARGVKVAEGVRDVKQLTIAPNESQFLETRMENVREIGRILNIAPSKLYDTSHATMNNESEEARAFVNDCLMPLGKRIAAARDEASAAATVPGQVRFRWRSGASVQRADGGVQRGIAEQHLHDSGSAGDGRDAGFGRKGFTATAKHGTIWSAAGQAGGRRR